jgi:hypothetical protein
MAVAADEEAADEFIRLEFLEFATFWTNNFHTDLLGPERYNFLARWIHELISKGVCLSIAIS